MAIKHYLSKEIYNPNSVDTSLLVAVLYDVYYAAITSLIKNAHL